jgi:hypothetical protein
LALALAWIACAVWNAVKPLPPGTHAASLAVRMAESQIDFVEDGPGLGIALRLERDAVGRAQQTIILDQSPLAPELAADLVARKRQRPNLAIVLIIDPLDESFGGTPARTLSGLERIGVVVARVRLERLRDSNPLYSSLWRLALSWWTNPFDEGRTAGNWAVELRRRNLRADQRQVLVADDGAGGWTSIVMSGPGSAAPARSNTGLQLRGHLARDIAASELRIAEWSSHDDRLPSPPPLEVRGVGTVDARLLTEGAAAAALREVISLAGGGDSISLIAPKLGDRTLIEAMRKAASRGARLQLLLDDAQPSTRAAAGELLRGGSANIELKWQSAPASAARYLLMRHRGDVWLELGSADFIRRSLEDLNLEASVELHLPAGARPARAAEDFFSRNWLRGAPYAQRADETDRTYWKYRIEEATGLSMF